MKNKNVIFIPATKNSELVVEPPRPAKKYFPEWFRNMPPRRANIDNTAIVKTGKSCIPLLDSFTSGYIQELPCDLTITNEGIDDFGNDILSYFWYGIIQPCSTRKEDEKSQNFFPNLEGYYNVEFSWITNWEPKTPKGYSTMYHHPSNRLDLPFHTLTGIIDTDVWSIAGPLPFLIKKGFEGTIPAGTPIYQITFIKRENWVSKSIEFDENFYKKHVQSVRKFFTGGYKKLYWNRKSFE
jgi:hypothetical protein